MDRTFLTGLFPCRNVPTFGSYDRRLWVSYLTCRCLCNKPARKRHTCHRSDREMKRSILPRTTLAVQASSHPCLQLADPQQGGSSNLIKNRGNSTNHGFLLERDAAEDPALSCIPGEMTAPRSPGGLLLLGDSYRG